MEKTKQEKIQMVLDYYKLGGLLSFELLPSGYANTNYKIEMNNSKNYVFRICHQQTLDGIIYEVNLMEELKKMKFPTAFPIPREDGEYATLLDSHYITIYEFIEGKEPELNPKTVEEIALKVGVLNRLKNWKTLRKQNHINWDACYQLIQYFEMSKYQYLDIFDYFIEQTEYLKKPLAEAVPRGIVHGDVFPDNTIFDGNKLIAIIDFEDACLDNLLFDIGMTINGFCFQNNQLDEKLVKIFIQSYNKTRKMTDKEIDLLPYYIQWGAHGMLSWHLKNNLLNKENKKQLVRARMFMTRVKILRKNEAVISRIIREAAPS